MFSVLRSADSVKMKKRNLKKQSQFLPGQIGVTSFVKGDYGNKPACGAEENKANQSQFWLIKHVQAFLNCVSADGLDFFGGWTTVDCRMRRCFVAWAILVHDVDDCVWADLPG